MIYAENNNQPLISIIVAVYNGHDTLQNCLDSINKQNYSNIELIVLDGGSTDGTKEILVRNEDAIEYYESKPDRGIAHAWNKGLKKCKGEWILFLGADDYLNDEYVISDMSIILGSDNISDIVYGDIYFEEGPYKGEQLGVPFGWKVFRRRMTFPHTACFHRKSLFEEIGNFDETFKIAVDYELFLRKKNLVAKYIHRLITVMGGDGVSSRNIVKSLLEARKAQLKNHVDKRYKIELWHAIYQLRNMLQKL